MSFNPEKKKAFSDFVEMEMLNFNNKRLESLKKIKLNTVLCRKNPYLFRAKGIETSAELIKEILDASISSKEETIFGNSLEAIAIKACELSCGGRKSTTEGIDLEFDRDDIRYLVAVKSGPNWGNSSSIKKLEDHFNKAQKVFRTGNHKGIVRCINGCCYGKEKMTDKGSYFKCCGQEFWELITEEEDFYKTLIEPLGEKAKEHNDSFMEQYTLVLNKLVAEFSKEYVDSQGRINWDAILELNSKKFYETV